MAYCHPPTNGCPTKQLERPLIFECSGKQVQRLTAETALTKVQGELNKIRAYEDGRKEREGEYKARMDEEHRCTYVRIHAVQNAAFSHDKT
jgi:hypothetical protein